MDELLKKYPFLKRQLKEGENFTANNREVWTKENLLDGLKKFFDDNGRFPAAEEIDRYKYLPSSRQIQRAFGGLKNLRKDLGLEITDYGSGAPRSAIAKTVNARGRNAEKEMEKILIDYFGEHFVHIEKPLNKYYTDPANTAHDGKSRADFFVYVAGDYEFCVDVFYASSIANLTNIINIKTPNYTGLKINSYLVNMNENIPQDRIDSLRKNKRSQLDGSIKIMNKTKFIEFTHTLRPLKTSTI